MNDDDDAPESPLSDLAFLTGRWSVEGQAFASAYGAASVFGGDVVATWGPGKAWIRLDQTWYLGPVGSYSVVILVFFDPGLGRLRAYSVDSAGSGRAFEVHVARDGEAAFTSELSPVDGTVQRFGFVETGPGRLRFSVELSTDGGGTFRSFSEALWTPRLDE